MTTTATIIQNDPQADGGIHARYLFTHVESGQTRRSGLYTLDPGTDVQAFGDSMTADENVNFKEREVKKAQTMYYAGDNMSDVYASGEFDIITELDMQKVCLRDSANLMIEVPISRAEDLSACSVWTTTLSPPVQVEALTNSAHTWAVGEANAYSNALSGLKVAMDQLQAAGQGEQDVLDGVIP